jgi:hypothetical protein
VRLLGVENPGKRYRIGGAQVRHQTMSATGVNGGSVDPCSTWDKVAERVIEGYHTLL